jgi:hypothetical protein
MLRHYQISEIVFQPLPTHGNFEDITGQVFNRLTVIGFAGRIKKQSMWWCECECGTISCVNGSCLKDQHTKSCGCYNIDILKSKATHGATRGGVTPEYAAYCHSKARCENPNNPNYPDYGGRGIEFRFTSFTEFLAELGLRPSDGFSIDRIDHNGHYEKGNVRWATREEQARNKRNNVNLEYEGRIQCVAAWAEELGFAASVISKRLKRGWSIEQALTTHLRKL